MLDNSIDDNSAFFQYKLRHTCYIVLKHMSWHILSRREETDAINCTLKGYGVYEKLPPSVVKLMDDFPYKCETLKSPYSYFSYHFPSRACKRFPPPV